LFNVYKRLLLFLSRFFYIFNVLLFLEERFSSMTQPQPKKYDGHMQVKLSERWSMSSAGHVSPGSSTII